MKFKALFVIFNIVLFLSFLTIFLLPFFILDASFMLEFWAKNWYFGAIFLVILALVNLAFLANWKMLSYLEQEDWPALSRYLEGEVFEKGHCSKRKVQLLCDSLLLLGDFATVRKLQDLLAEKKPALLGALGVRFSAAHLLAGDYEAMYALSGAHGASSAGDRDWMSFFAAFSRHMSKKYEESAELMLAILETARDPLVVALSGYISGELLVRMVPSRSEELKAAASGAKTKITAKYTRQKWLGFVEEEKAGIHVVILSKLINELDSWLYGAA
jgi:hypothetical protein